MTQVNKGSFFIKQLAISVFLIILGSTISVSTSIEKNKISSIQEEIIKEVEKLELPFSKPAIKDEREEISRQNSIIGLKSIISVTLIFLSLFPIGRIFFIFLVNKKNKIT
jgi:hypothetical protein